MSQALLVINSGSSSVKFAVYDTQGAQGLVPDAGLERLAHGRIEGIGAQPRLRVWDASGGVREDRRIRVSADPVQGPEEAFEQLLDWLGQHAAGRTLGAVGHRVVHGGADFARPARVTPEVLARLDALRALAPLHQPHNLSAIRALAALLPGLAQVACFDTEFHTAQPWVAQAFALPRHITDAGVKRYGFHGLSYEFIASALPDHLGPLAEARVVVAHLGNGASLCAMQGRRSVATTMGFTALDGLVMGTRCGSLDPGVVLHLVKGLGLDAPAVEKMLYEQSGLLGVSGLSGDMRTLEASAAPEARDAIDLYAYRIRQHLGSLVACLGGLDALVFTAGIGENSASLRQRVCQDAAWLGVALDEDENLAPGGGARCIGRPGSRVAVWVVPTNEELMIARHTQAVLQGRGAHDWRAGADAG